MSAEINLLKNELRKGGGFSFGKRSLVSLYITLSILAVEVLAYAGLEIYQRRIGTNTRQLEQQSRGIDFEISKIDEDRLQAISFQRRLNNLQNLLDNHVFWSPVFEELQKFTLKTASLNTLQVDLAEQKFVLSGVVPSYTDLGKLMLGLEQSSHVREVNLQSSGLSEGGLSGYSFNLEVSFDPKLLLK